MTPRLDLPLLDPDDVRCERCGHDHLRGGRDAAMPACRAEGCGRVHTGCHAHKRNRLPEGSPPTPCHSQYLAIGSALCGFHGGTAAQLRAKAAERATLARVSRLYGVASDAKPVEMAEEELAAVHGFIRALRALAAEISPAEMFFGVAEVKDSADPDGGGDGEPAAVTWKAGPHAIVREIRTQQELLFRMLSRMSEGDLNRATIRVREAQYALIKAWVLDLVAKLGYPPDGDIAERDFALRLVREMFAGMERGITPAALGRGRDEERLT